MSASAPVPTLDSMLVIDAVSHLRQDLSHEELEELVPKVIAYILRARPKPKAKAMAAGAGDLTPDYYLP